MFIKTIKVKKPTFAVIGAAVVARGAGAGGFVSGDNSDSGEDIVACGVRDEKRSAKTGVFERNGLGGV